MLVFLFSFNVMFSHVIVLLYSASQTYANIPRRDQWRQANNSTCNGGEGAGSGEINDVD
jgi:hypothetical protein